MGLAASQARYLALTARKSDLELKSQNINSRRIQLSYKTSEIATRYTDKMNNSKIMMKGTKLVDGKETDTWNALSFENLIKDGTFALIGAQGTPLQPQPYALKNIRVMSTSSLVKPFEDITQTAYNALNAETKKLFQEKALPYLGQNLSSLKNQGESDAAAKARIEAGGIYKVGDNGVITTADNYQKVYTLRDNIPYDEWEKISQPADLPQQEQAYFSAYREKVSQSAEMEFDEEKYYANDAAVDIQTLLMSGRAQIVSREFFNYLCNNGYDFDKGMNYEVFQQAQLDFENKYPGVKTIVDWSSDEDAVFQDKNYTEDDEAAYREYEVATAKIQAQDKILEMEAKNIETQHKAIETELESVKKVIQKNMEETFKIFS